MFGSVISTRAEVYVIQPYVIEVSQILAALLLLINAECLAEKQQMLTL